MKEQEKELIMEKLGALSWLMNERKNEQGITEAEKHSFQFYEVTINTVMEKIRQIETT